MSLLVKSLLFSFILINSFSVSAQEPERVYTYVEKMPVFPGGQEALFEHIARNLQYPMEALEARLEGKVFVNFVVDTTGNVGQIKVAKSVHPLLDREALRVVSSIPRYTPGQQGGHVVPVHFTLPIQFKLNSEYLQAFKKNGHPRTAQGSIFRAYYKADTTGRGVSVEGGFLYSVPGSLERMIQDHLSTIPYPTEGLRQRIQGKIYMAFKVDSAGNVSYSAILNGLHPTLDQAALKALSQSTPLAFKQKKIQAGIRYVITILFQLPTNMDEQLAQRLAEESKTPAPKHTPARYPGGPEALHAFLAAAPYPEHLRKQMLSGRIFITINLDENGWIKTMEPLLDDLPANSQTPAVKSRRKALEELYESALKYLIQMPQWEPARWLGQPGQTSFVLPFSYNAIPPTTPNPMVYVYADEMPSLPNPNIIQSSSHPITYPVAALRAQAEGIVWIYYVVDENGKISQPTVLKSPHPSLSEEALRVVAGLPHYIPGKHHGQPVKVGLTIPINFSIR